MRKPILLLSVLAYSLVGNAQFILEYDYHFPRVGDKLVKQQVEYCFSSETGEEVIWDLRKQKPIDDNYLVTYSKEKDSLLIRREQRTLFKYTLSGDSLLFAGYENPQIYIEYSLPEIELIYPVRYGDEQSSFFQGKGNYCNQIDLNVYGKSAYKVDGYGKILLPEEEVIEDVLRIHYSKKQVERQLPSYYCSKDSFSLSVDSIMCRLEIDTVWRQTDIYRWYAKGYRYPVYEAIESSLYIRGEEITLDKFSFYYSPHEQYYGLNNDYENQALRENIVDNKKRVDEAKFHNNQNKSTIEELTSEICQYQGIISEDGKILKLNYQLSEDGELGLTLYDVQGRLIVRNIPNYHQAGSYTISIPLENTMIREYLLQINLNGNVFGEKIIKR